MYTQFLNLFRFYSYEKLQKELKKMFKQLNTDFFNYVSLHLQQFLSFYYSDYQPISGIAR